MGPLRRLSNCTSPPTHRRFPNMTMSPALLYLWWTLLKRRTHSFARDLRRPTKLIGFAALVGLVGFLFYFREHEFVGQLVRRETAIGCGLIMLGGSVFKGFLRR